MKNLIENYAQGKGGRLYASYWHQGEMTQNFEKMIYFYRSVREPGQHGINNSLHPVL